MAWGWMVGESGACVTGVCIAAAFPIHSRVSPCLVPVSSALWVTGGLGVWVWLLGWACWVGYWVGVGLTRWCPFQC